MAKYFPIEELLFTVMPMALREQAGFIRRHIAEGDWARARRRVGALGAFLRMIPGVARHRLAAKGRYGYKVYLKLVPTFIPRALPYERWDYVRSGGEAAGPSRIIMGVTDDVLGDGWHSLCDDAPQYRWTVDEARCYLAVEKGVPSVLQLHVRQPFPRALPQTVTALVDGVEGGVATVSDAGWRALRFRCAPRGSVAEVVLRVAPCIPADTDAGLYDRGIQVNEVSLLPGGSPFIRAGSPATRD
jgi:hypothetical protein